MQGAREAKDSAVLDGVGTEVPKPDKRHMTSEMEGKTKCCSKVDKTEQGV